MMWPRDMCIQLQKLAATEIFMKSRQSWLSFYFGFVVDSNALPTGKWLVKYSLLGWQLG